MSTQLLDRQRIATCADEAIRDLALKGNAYVQRIPLPPGATSINIPKLSSAGGEVIPPTFLADYERALRNTVLRKPRRQRPRRVPSYRERQRRGRQARR